MKNAWKWLLWAAVVMIGLPFLAVKLVPGDAGMAVCFLLFFAVDPVFSAVSGWENPGNWWLPAVVAGFFLAGVWLFFDLGETAFLRYAAVYLALGWAAAGVHRFMKKK